jgi:hypothetical protein
VRRAAASIGFLECEVRAGSTRHEFTGKPVLKVGLVVRGGATRAVLG